MNQSVHALAIIAHPDDEAFLLAGTCLKFAEEGKTTAVFCATRGEKGTDRLNRGLTREQLGVIRSSELQRACQIVKCSSVECGKHEDGGLDQEDYSSLVREIRDKIDTYQPRVILTFGEEGISGHRDHVCIGKAAIEAAKMSKHRPKEVWLASMPSSKMDEFHQHLHKRKIHHSHFHEKPLKGVPDEELLKIDIRKYSGLKTLALKTHKSQFIPNLTFDLFLENEYFEVMELA